MLCRNHDAVEPWSGGDQAALEQLAEQVYPGLRRIAHGCKKNERAGNTLQAIAPVYEVYLRLEDVTKIERRERARFFAMAAQDDAAHSRNRRRAPLVRNNAASARQR